MKRHLILTKKNEFKKIFSTGKYYYSKLFSCKYILFKDNSTDLHSKIGIIASRKVGKAYLRNKIKRRFRHIIRDNFSNLPNYCHLVIISNKKTGSAKFMELKNEINYFIKKINNL